MKQKERWQRSVIKAITYRLQNTATTMVVVYLLTGKFSTSLSVGAFEIVFKPFLYFLHERLWDRTDLGKKETPPLVIWFTGLPLSGKGLLADEIFLHLKKRKFKVQRLDGDEVTSLFPEQGFTREERNAYIRRMGYMAKILKDQGVTVIASFISPFEESRQYVRNLCRENFLEIYVSTPQEECERLDKWKLYERARNGEIQNFVGVHQQYEPPSRPELSVDLSKMTANQAAKIIIRGMRKYAAGISKKESSGPDRSVLSHGPEARETRN